MQQIYSVRQANARGKKTKKKHPQPKRKRLYAFLALTYVLKPVFFSDWIRSLWPALQTCGNFALKKYGVGRSYVSITMSKQDSVYTRSQPSWFSTVAAKVSNDLSKLRQAYLFIIDLRMGLWSINRSFVFCRWEFIEAVSFYLKDA